MRPQALALAVALLVLAPALAADASSQDSLRAMYQKNMYTSMVKAWSTLLNPFGVNIMESSETAYTYLVSLIIMFFVVMELFGHSEAVKVTNVGGSFSVLQPLTSGSSIGILLVSNWMLGFIIKFGGVLPNEGFIMSFMVPFMLIYFILFDLISYFRPGFIRVRTRKLIVFLTSIYAADLGLLSPLMDSVKRIMMSEGFTAIGLAGWGTYAMAFAFLMLAKFLQRVQSSFVTSQRDYIQAQVAEARYQMYKTMAEQSFGDHA